MDRLVVRRRTARSPGARRRGAARWSRRKMAAPTRSRIAWVKRLARYLAELPWLVWDFGQGEDAIRTFADCDWAGCPRTRRSTSGGLVVLYWGAVSSGRPRKRPWRCRAARQSASAMSASRQKALAYRPGPATLGRSARWSTAPTRQQPRASRVCRAWAGLGTSSAVFCGCKRH